MRAALISLLLLTGTAALAQDNTAPVVLSEPPAQSAAPATDAGAVALPEAAATEGSASSPSNEAPGGAGEAAGPAAPSAAVPATAPETATATAAPAAAPAPAPAVAPAAAAPQPLSAHSVRLDALFWDAHWIVQSVMVGLAVAAFAALVILIHKTVEFMLAFAAMRRTAAVLARSADLHQAAAALSKRNGPAADIIRAADEELRLAEAEPDLIPGTRERTDAAAARIEAGAAQKLRAGTGLLASIGSLSPFVGLFGTVFGIMNSFIAIAETKTTNLAVVAPGIAEALLATAIGLAAAIPAVAIYNICTRRLAKYRHQLNDVAAAAARLQSRALDRLAARTRGV